MSVTDGRFDFGYEFMDAIRRTLETYEQQRDEALSDQERSLALCYILGLARCDLEAICAAHVEQSGLSGDPMATVAEWLAPDSEEIARRVQRMGEEMTERGWGAR